MIVIFLLENYSLIYQNTVLFSLLQWMGFGPEQLSIPDNFIYPMSFATYGGHSSLHIRYNSSSTEPLYFYSKNSTNITTVTRPLNDNIAFLQGVRAHG